MQGAVSNDSAEHSTRLVLFALAYHHNPQTGLCNPSIVTLARETKLARSTVLTSLSALESSHLILRKPVTGRSTSYELNLSNADWTRPDSEPVQILDPSRKPSKPVQNLDPNIKNMGGAASADAARPQRFSRNPFA